MVENKTITTFVFPALMTLLLLLGHIASDVFSLAYDREAIQAGQTYLLMSGQFVHTNSFHLLLNTTALWLLWLTLGPALKTSAWFSSSAVSLLGVALGLYFLNPEVLHYVGFSGALHGLFVTGALALIRSKALMSVALLTLIAAKLFFELRTNDMTANAALIDSPIVHFAHLYGALAGIVSWSALLALNLVPCLSSPFPKR